MIFSEVSFSSLKVEFPTEQLDFRPLSSKVEKSISKDPLPLMNEFWIVKELLILWNSSCSQMLKTEILKP